MKIKDPISAVKVLLFFIACISFNACLGKKALVQSGDIMPPDVPREFRAAWVATVANINWPSERNLSVQEQKEEAIYLLDLLAQNNFNAVIFQVRPQADALYKSELEPWSYYLTGKQGLAPDPLYDPLRFWIHEAHKRGLELHAWLNPYRAHHIRGGEINKTSIVRTKPHLALSLAQGYWWLDPSQKETQDHSYDVVLDIVKRYDVDGIHFDDYFYPYPSYNNGEDFPDDKSWKLYQDKNGRLSKGDWRRKGVNQFIKRVYKGIKDEKSHVKFGLSPFGIWRPGNPSSIEGFDQYDQLYADAKLWLNKGWVDYYTPQLYWPVNQIPQSFPVLLGWWKSQNYKNKHLWPGISIGRLEGEKAIDETLNQIMITRGMLEESPGIVHWSIAPLVHSPELTEAIAQGPYAQQALIPSDHQKGEKYRFLNAKADLVNDSLLISWKDDDPASTKCFVIYSKMNDVWSYQIIGSKSNAMKLEAITKDLEKINVTPLSDMQEAQSFIDVIEFIAITTIDRFGYESKLNIIALPEIKYKGSPSIEEIRNIKTPK